MGSTAVSQCFLLVILAIYTSADDSCKAPIQAFAVCSKGEVTERGNSDMKEAEGSIDDKITACFTANGCAAPDFKNPIDNDLDADGKKNWKGVVDWWDGLDTDKRHCVISQVRGGFQDRLTQCMNDKIPGFDYKALSTDKEKLSDTEKKKRKTLADHRFRIRVAMRKCEDKSDAIRKCLKKDRAEKIEKESCAIRKKCADGLKPECQKVWTESFKKPICDCVAETADTLRKLANDPEQANKRDDAIKLKCGVELPKVNAEEVKKQKDLGTRIKDYVSLFEDRLVPFCHPCDGIPV